MQTPPPVANLLLQLRRMASNVGQLQMGSDTDWDWRPDANEWSITEVICHLRDVEGEVHQSRFRAVLEGEDVFLPGVSADEWAERRGYKDQDGESALNDFLSLRQATVEMLSDLMPEVWQRQGIHAFFGRTSMHELLSLVTRHDEIHWEQIKSLLADQKSGEMKDGN
ncbi:MAG: hypothetical protein BMS9Abin02_0298 [Anaerolineae bacterium]|nr:MAG: hypothetical protein BMS9Abin02_0298 [Anaerolineae bacterium]